jgi:EpsI family protein
VAAACGGGPGVLIMRNRVLIVLVALVLAAGAVARANRSEATPLRTPFVTFPMTIGAWRGVQQPPFTEDVLKVLGLNDYLTRAYVADKRAIDLYLGYWESQRQGDTIHSPLNCLPGSGWEPMTRSIVSLAGLPAGSTVNRVVIQNGVDRELVLYWYQSHGRVIASEYKSRFFLVADAIRYNRTDGSIVRLVTPIARDGIDAEQQADLALNRFAADLFPSLDQFLPR